MQSINSLEVLSKIALFDGLSERQLRDIADRLHQQSYPAGAHIVEQGQVGFGLFMIVSGGAEVQYTSADGSMSVVNSLGSYDYFGEMALLDDGPRSASVVATVETTCLLLDRIDFLAILMNGLEMGVLIATELAKRVRKLLDTIGKN